MADLFNHIREELSEQFRNNFREGARATTDDTILYVQANDPGLSNTGNLKPDPELARQLESFDPRFVDGLLDVAKQKAGITIAEAREVLGPELTEAELASLVIQEVQRVPDFEFGAAIALEGQYGDLCIILEPDLNNSYASDLVSEVSGVEIANIGEFGMDSDDIERFVGAHEGAHCEQNEGDLIEQGIPFELTEVEAEALAELEAMRLEVANGNPEAAELMYAARLAGHDISASSHQLTPYIDLDQVLPPDYERQFLPHDVTSWSEVAKTPIFQDRELFLARVRDHELNTQAAQSAGTHNHAVNTQAQTPPDHESQLMQVNPP